MRFYTKQDTEKFDTIPLLYIKVSLEKHVFRLTLSRPEKRNAFTPTMAAEIAFALAYANDHEDVRCIIVDAEGPVFCAGADLNAFHDPSADIQNPDLPRSIEEVRLGEAFTDLSKPSIALVQGPVLAGGFLIICGCTFVLSIPEAAFSLPEVKRGIWPMQVMASLLPIVSQRRILEMAITGKSYTADEAFRMGLVTKIADQKHIREELNDLTKIICNHAPFAIRSGMKALQNLSEISEAEQHSYLKEELDKLLQSEDAKEGTHAFKEKREPVWRNR